MDIKFKAMPTKDGRLLLESDFESFLDAGLEFEYGYVIGNLIMHDTHPYMVGNIAEVTEEYINFEWWMPIQRDTIEVIIKEEEK